MFKDEDNKVTFTAQEDELLIKLVAKHPFLYNPSLSDYRSTYKRDKVWEEIAEALIEKGFTGDGGNCKSRWKNIKDTYFRQKKKNKSTSGTITSPKSKYSHYSRLLSFLEPLTRNAGPTTSDNTPAEETPTGSPPIITIAEDQDFQELTNVAMPIDANTFAAGQYNFEEEPLSMEPTASSTQDTAEDTEDAPVRAIKRGARGIRKKDNVLRRLLIAPRKPPRHRTFRPVTVSAKQSVDAEDEIDLFTRQARSVLKKLPAQFQIRAMHELFEILTKYKMLAVDSQTTSELTTSFPSPGSTGINVNQAFSANPNASQVHELVINLKEEISSITDQEH